MFWILSITNIWPQQWKIVGLDAPSSYKIDYETYKVINSDEYSTIIPNEEYFRPHISLILSGGGARGFAHIGVIQGLEKRGIKINSIVGTSIGAIVGSLYASGYTPDEIIDIFHKIDWEELFKLIENTDRREYIIDNKSLFDKSLLKVYFKNFEAIFPQGFSFANRLNEILSNLLYKSKYIPLDTYDDLRYPFRAVATDIVQGTTVILKEKSLPLSVRASSTIPLRHSPVKLDNMLLVDGGLMANLPVSSAIKEFNPDITIAVDVTSPLFDFENLDRAWNVADQIVSIEMKKYTELERKKADYVITPKLGNYSNTNFEFLDSLITLGRDAFDELSNILIDEINRKTDENINLFLSEHFKNELFFDNIELQNVSKVDSFKIFSLVKNGKLIPVSEILKILIKSEGKYNKITYVVSDNNKLIIKANSIIQLKSIEYADQLPDELIKFINQLQYEYFAEEVNIDLINKLAESILSEARKLGYCFLYIDTIKWNSTNNSLYFKVNPGYIENIRIIGNQSIKNNIIERELLFKEKQIATYEQIRQSRGNLMATSLFSFVDIYPQKNENDNIDMIVFIAEAGNQILQLGIRADNERNLQASFDFIHNNLFNTGLQLNFSFFGGSRNQNFNITGLNPKLLNADFTTNFLLYLDNRRYFVYENIVDLPNTRIISNNIGENQWNRVGGMISFGNQIGKNGKLSIDLRLEKYREFSIGKTPGNFSNLSTFKINFQYDSGDDPYYPTEGSVINTYLESNLIPTSQYFTSFSKIYISLSNFNTFLDRNTICYGGMIGAGDQTMPTTEMFWMGGENNFWGLRQDQYFGRQIAKVFLTYRYRIPVKTIFDMYFSLHYNTGRVWLNTTQIKMSSFLHGFGLSYSFNTPLGPLTLSIAKPMMFDKNLGAIFGETQTYFSFGVKI